MKLRRTLVLAFALFALVAPLTVHAQNSAYPVSGADPDDVPVKVVVNGLSTDRQGIDFQVTLLTHKPVKTVELGVTAFTSEHYIGALDLRWPQGGASHAVSQGRTYACTQRVLSKPLAADEQLSITRGVLQVTFTDGSTWTSADKYGASGR